MKGDDVDRTVYVEIDRGGGDIETRGLTGTDDEIDETLTRWAKSYGPVWLLDKDGHRLQEILPEG